MEHFVIIVNGFQLSYLDDYVGETTRRMSERVIDHNGRDENSVTLKYQIEKGHPYVHNTRIL